MRPPIRAVILGTLLTLVVGGVAAAADSDGDLLSDEFESRWGVTDPHKKDSDGDGVVDSAEDNDNDRLGNLGEQRFGTDPGRKDSDGDGVIDSREDSDGNGRSNGREQDRRSIPAGLRPDLAEAKADVSPYKAGCQTTHRQAGLVHCYYGRAESGKTIVLMGDSHAVMVLSPIKTVVEEKGWRLVTVMKKACPPILGIHNDAQKWIDDGRSCRQWRRNALEWLNANPPDHIILSHSDQYSIATFKGRQLLGRKAADAWGKGMRRTMRVMPPSSQVLLLGDIPVNDGNPVHCLKKNPRNISKCVTAREPKSKRIVEAALRQATVNNGGLFRTVYDKVCTYDPCPIIQGNVLMWRDRGHYTATFSDVLTPSFRTMLGNVFGGPAAKRKR